MRRAAQDQLFLQRIRQQATVGLFFHPVLFKLTSGSQVGGKILNEMIITKNQGLKVKFDQIHRISRAPQYSKLGPNLNI